MPRGTSYTLELTLAGRDQVPKLIGEHAHPQQCVGGDGHDGSVTHRTDQDTKQVTVDFNTEFQTARAAIEATLNALDNRSAPACATATLQSNDMLFRTLV